MEALTAEHTSCTTCGVDFTSARHWADKPAEHAPEKCNLCAHSDEESPEVPLLSRAKKWLKMESAWPSRLEVPSCWGCGQDYKERWSPEDLAPHPTEPDAGVCPDCHEELGGEEAAHAATRDYWHGKSLKNEAYGGREVSHPFSGGKRHPNVTKAHVPLVWENMLGTVYARSPKGEVKYFDYDWDAAHAHAGVKNASDLRITKFDRNKHRFGGPEAPRHRQSVLWGVHPKEASVKESLSRHCEIWKCNKGQWWMDLAHREYGERHDSQTYGPFRSQDHADQYLSDAHSNPGAVYIDDTGKRPSPTKSPNGSPVHSPRKSRWGGWESVETEIRRSIIESVKAKEKKPFNPPPEGPKDVNPFEVHKYFMGMADWHEKEGRKHEKLGSFKPLFSSDRSHHTRRSQFHQQLQNAFAQKAIDALNFQQQPDKPGVREALQRMIIDMGILSEDFGRGSQGSVSGARQASGSIRDLKKQLKSAGAPDWAVKRDVSRIKGKTPNVSPESHIRSMKGEPTPPSDAPEDVDPRDWARMLGKKRTESTSPFDLEALRTSHPNTFKHLIKRSREAEANTGEADGEYGTYHHLKSLPPSKQRAGLENALVYHAATDLGPDMSHDLVGRLTAKVRKSVPDIVGAFEKGELHSHVEPHVRGPQSDRFRHSADRYY